MGLHHRQDRGSFYANEYKDKPLTREKVILNDKPIWLGETIIVDEKKGGKSRKSRKMKKSRKSRKMKKTKRAKRNSK